MQGPAGTGAPRVETDEDLVELWVRSRAPFGRAIDRAGANRFLAFLGRPLGQVAAGDLRAFGESLNDLTPAPRARMQSAVRSLLTFGRRVGYLPAARTGRRPRPR